MWFVFYSKNNIWYASQGMATEAAAIEHLAALTSKHPDPHGEFRHAQIKFVQLSIAD